VLRVGLLGCGEIGLKNADALAAAPNTKLVACFDPARALAEEVGTAHGAVTYPTAEALVEARDVDAVFVAVPHHLHADLAVAAADAGKHVIVEKPPANTLAAAVEMTSAAERAGVVLSICFPYRYQPHVIEAKRMIDAGALGDITGVHVKVLSKKPETYWHGGFSGRSTSDWRASKEKAGGGFLIMNLCHYLDTVRHLIGSEAETVSAHIERPAGGRDVEDAVSLSIGYENAAIGSIAGSAALPGFESGRTEIHLWGEHGHLALEPRLEVYTLRASAGLRTGRWHSFDLESLPEVDIRAMYLGRLASAFVNGHPPDVSPADGLAIQALMEGAYRSSELAQVIRPAGLLADIRKGASA
jgi:predicted dehydrogenase